MRRVGDELGAGPETLRGRDPPGGSGRSPATGPAPPPRRPGAPGSWRRRSAGRGRGARSGGARRLVHGGGARPPVPLICQYIDQRKEEFGVEPICTVLTESGCRIAPSTYYAARSRPPSKRSVSDAAVPHACERPRTQRAVPTYQRPPAPVIGGRRARLPRVTTPPGSSTDRGKAPCPQQLAQPPAPTTGKPLAR